MQTFAAANYDAIKLREYYSLQKQIPLLVSNQSKTFFFVDDFGQIIGPENFDMNFALELKETFPFSNVEVAIGEKLFLNQTTYFVYQLPVFDKQSQQVLGIVYEAVDQNIFRNLTLRSIWKFVIFFFFLLVVEVAVLFVIIKFLLKPLNAFLSQWTTADDLMASSRELLAAENGLTKDVLLLAESLSQQFSKHAVNVSLGKVSAQMAHDVRGPLSVLNGFLEFFQRKVSTEDEKLFYEVAERAIFRIRSMTEEMLDSVRSGNVNKNSCDVSKLLHQLIVEAKTRADAQLIKFELSITDHLTASLDEQKMYRVFLNLVTNGMQAMPEGGTIYVKAGNVADKIQVEIKDTGKGIAPENISKLFQSGFSFGKKDGVGLGLAYCFNVVQSHHGTIQVQSKLGVGTSFCVELPQ